jgi:8-oxo-dGTP pyrophosphatase MutT (NUDIX family)
MSVFTAAAAAAADEPRQSPDVEIVPGFDAAGVYLRDVERPLVMRPERTGIYGQAGQLFLVRGADAKEPLFGVAVRHRDKKAWPRGLDFTASGMSDPGEDEKTTTLREASEEIGLQLDPAALRLVASWVPRDGYSSRSAVFVADWGEEPIPFNTADIEEIRWMTAAEIRAEAKSGVVMKSDLRAYALSAAWPPTF